VEHAGLPPSEIDWVMAHGTGLPIADVSESRGIEAAMGRHAFNIPVSSIRGALGQSFASGGGYQLAAACRAIQTQSVPPTLNFSGPAEGCRLDYVPNVARFARVRRVLINAAGVGGTHGGLVISAYAN
jgi:3-oxoacyl-[acyl-carrier-protein] synthase II